MQMILSLYYGRSEKEVSKVANGLKVNVRKMKMLVSTGDRGILSASKARWAVV